MNIDNIKKYYVVEENDFVYNPRMSNYAPFGPVNRNKLGEKRSHVTSYTVFKIQNIDLNFIEFYFKSSKWYRFMALNGDQVLEQIGFLLKIGHLWKCHFISHVWMNKKNRSVLQQT